jgi:flagellar basal-body rod protein FlgC
MSLLNIFDIAASSLTAQSVRLNTTASNMANAEAGSSSAEKTYKAKQPIFMEEENELNNGIDNLFSDSANNYLGSKVRVQQINESQAKPLSNYEPGNPMADKDGMVYYPDINIVEQMTDMISASRSFQANVEVLTTTKNLMDKTLEMGN